MTYQDLKDMDTNKPTKKEQAIKYGLGAVVLGSLLTPLGIMAHNSSAKDDITHEQLMREIKDVNKKLNDKLSQYTNQNQLKNIDVAFDIEHIYERLNQLEANKDSINNRIDEFASRANNDIYALKDNVESKLNKDIIAVREELDKKLNKTDIEDLKRRLRELENKRNVDLSILQREINKLKSDQKIWNKRFCDGVEELRMGPKSKWNEGPWRWWWDCSKI